MRLLMIGDIVGRPGKHACAMILPTLIAQREIDCVIANAENAVAGSGLTPQIFKKLCHQGVDGVTLGDHIYRRREIVPLLQESDRIVKPANLPSEAAGRELAIIPTRSGQRVAIISLLGRTYMNVRADCPFHAVDRVLAQVPDDVKLVLVDVHAEATAEKIALGWYLDGRASVVVGTHTHVQTADERVLPKGTAYITDVGMTGPHDSVLGRNKERVIASLVTGMPHPYDVAEENVRLNGALVELDSRTGRAISIERVSLAERDFVSAAGASKPDLSDTDEAADGGE